MDRMNISGINVLIFFVSVDKEIIIGLEHLLIGKERRKGQMIAHELFVADWIDRSIYTKIFTVPL